VLRAIAMIDGEHYPPVVRAALDTLSAEYEIVGAAFVGGTEKIGAERDLSVYAVPVTTAESVDAALAAAIERHRPDVVIDLSDEPVLTAADRVRLANIALAAGVAYRGADFTFTPPPELYAASTPTLAIVGTGKRVGKTAISAFVARYLKDTGRDVVVLAMGRGGPAEPELIRADELQLSTDDLVALARQGVHAASDNYEDAMMSRVATVGCRRCGGGLAGAPFVSTVLEGAMLADSLGKEVLIAEGSGAAAPPVVADATLLVVGAARGAGYLTDYFGPYRLHRADALVIAGAEEPVASPEQAQALVEAARAARPGLPVSLVSFRPRPLEDIAGRRVFFATTAPERLTSVLARYLEDEFGCTVVATSNQLSDRASLRIDLDRAAGTFDLLLTELKAAAVDVVATCGDELGIPTVFCDNEPHSVGGDPLPEVIEGLLALSADRHSARSE
jgi:cyclic 2,3-diphosphoglycerate synthetase